MANLKDWREIIDFLAVYKGRILGLVGGLFAAVLVLTVGVVAALFILLCMGIGYYIGRRYDNKQPIEELINDILPPQQ